MKIVYITGDFGLPSETFVNDLVAGLVYAGEEVVVLCNHRMEFYEEIFTIEETNFLTLTSINHRLRLRLEQLRGNCGQFQTFARQKRHAYSQLLPALKKHKPDVAYIDFGTVAALTKIALCEFNIPFVVHFHGADISSALNKRPYRAELQQVFYSAAALIVASNHIRRLLILEGAPPDKIYLVRLGVNLGGLIHKPWNEREREQPSIVFLGRFTPKKHPVALVEAFAIVKQQIPTAKLSMIGDGPEMPRVRQRIGKLGLSDSICLYGALPREKALPIVNNHWVFAQHSVTAPDGDQEGFGLSLAEAAVLQLPIVSTLHNGIPEQVIEGQTGFLVREFDYESMASRLVQLLQDPKLAQQMGECGCSNILEQCNMDKRVTEIRLLLSKVCMND